MAGAKTTVLSHLCISISHEHQLATIKGETLRDLMSGTEVTAKKPRPQQQCS